jgi:hypothetical protein
LFTATQTSTGDCWTYSYDFQNRMTSGVEKSSGGTIIAQATFTYDALDGRIGMDENGTHTSSQTPAKGSSRVRHVRGQGLQLTGELRLIAVLPCGLAVHVYPHRRDPERLA